METLGEATTKCLQRLKRKAPSSWKEEEVKKLKKDDDHDQVPSHHEGENGASEKKLKTIETSNPADPTKETYKPLQTSQNKEQTIPDPTQSVQTTPTPTPEQTLPNLETSEANPETPLEHSEAGTYSPTLYLSQIPLTERVKIP